MFTPDDFDKASVGPYMKFQDGPNRIRILKEPVTGYKVWVDRDGNVVPKNKMAGEGGKPIRVRHYDEFDMKQRGAMGAFSAMIVWNYDLEKVQILELKQVTIMAMLDALANSKSWGDITTYDIVITKTRTGTNSTDVEYSVMPEPKTDLSEEILKAYNEVKIDLNKLYEGEDPFITETLSDKDMDKISNAIDSFGDLDG